MHGSVQSIKTNNWLADNSIKHVTSISCTLESAIQSSGTKRVRLTKKHYYCAFFNNNLSNMKKTWQDINESLNCCKRKCKSVSKLKDPDNNNNLTNDSSRIPNILNKHFSNVGNILASKLPPAERPFTEHLRKSSLSPELSFFFKTVTPSEIQFQILSLPNSKLHGLYSWPRLFKRSIALSDV